MFGIIRAVFLSAIAIAALPIALASAGDMGLHASGAWVRDVPPSMKMTSGYLTLRNDKEEDVAIVAARSADFKMVEMHVTRNSDGVMTMQEVKYVTVPAGGEVAFEPGGLHLMLMGRNPSSADKTEINLQLEFDDGSTLSVSAPIHKAAPGHMHGHGQTGS